MSDYQLIFNPLASSGFTLVPTAEYISSLANTVTSTEILDALGYTPFNSADVSNDATLADNSAYLVPTQYAIKTYADNLLSVASALTYKGTIDASTSPNYPAGNVGDVYTFSTSGMIGGDSGESVTMGDLLICNTDNAGGTQSQVGTDWDNIQLALNGIILGPTSSNSGDFVTFNGSSGTVVQDSGLSLSTDTFLSSDLDTLIPSQKAVKTYVDNGIATCVSSDSLSITEGKTVTFDNQLTFSGTDSTSFIFPSASDTVVTLTATQTLTNKRIERRTILTSGNINSLTPASDSYDMVEVSTTASSGTFTVNNPTGTPVDGQSLVLRIKSENSMTYSWGNNYRFSTMVNAPVNSSGSSLTDYISFIYNGTDSIWDIGGCSNGH